MNKTSIEWTDYTWNPIRARLKGQGPKVHAGTFCTRISPGCTHCYASTINKRFGNGLEYTVPNLETVEFFIDEKILEEPLRRKKPTRIFVGDMFDLFHEAIPNELIARVLNVCEQASWHTFQLLTKRASRMLSFCYRNIDSRQDFPPRNVWFGVSVEDQQRADERIPLLLQTPAAVRWLSVEPMLEAVDLRKVQHPNANSANALDGIFKADGFNYCTSPLIDWVICGGESGPGARPFNLAWAESLLEQCRAAGVPFFMKQMGSNPLLHRQTSHHEERPGFKFSFRSMEFSQNISLQDRKGGDPEEWPEHLRVREFPAERTVPA